MDDEEDPTKKAAQPPPAEPTAPAPTRTANWGAPTGAKEWTPGTAGVAPTVTAPTTTDWHGNTDTTGDWRGGPTGTTPAAGTPTNDTAPAVMGDADHGLSADAKDDIDAARTQTRALTAREANFVGDTAPTVAPPPQVTAPVPVTAPTVKAATVAPAAQVGPVTVQRTTIAPMQGYTAELAGRTVIDPAAQAAAAQISPVERVAAAQVTGPQDQVRSGQMALLQHLQDVEAGRAGPSLAELQLKRGADTAVQDQYALAATAHGYGRLAALQSAQRNAAKTEQQANLDAAMARVKEQTDARQQLLTGLEGTRGQDIGVGTTNAQLAQDAAKFGAGAANTAGLQQAAMGTDVSKFNASATNTRAIAQGGLDSDLSKFDVAQTNDARKFTAGAENTGAIAQGEITSGESKTQAGITKDVDIHNAEAVDKVNQLTATFAQQAGMTDAQLKADVDKFNAEIANRTDIKNADLTQAANLANLDAELKQRGLNDAQRLAYLQAALQSQGQVLNFDTAKRQADIARDAADAAFWGGIFQMFGQVGAAAATKSDRRAKKDIKQIGGADSRRDLLAKLDGDGEDPDLAALLDGLKVYRYRYKDPSEPGAAPGEHFGPMAQDLEKAGPAGKSLVRDTPSGKMVDTGRAALMALSAIAEMRDKLKRKEAR